ncbi:MAG: YafY family protein [Pseudomonadota bacterium]
MRRTDRLFELIQLFRTGRLWRGVEIAERLEVSLRTVYRDIDTLVASGLPIEGERGVGYLLRAPIFLPPLALTEDELDALHFALDQAGSVGDADLAQDVRSLRGKLDAVAGDPSRSSSPARTLSAFAATAAPSALGTLRQAIRDGRCTTFTYESLCGDRSIRTVRPLHLEWWGAVWTLTAWCELRDDFRVFRVDRCGDVRPLDRTFVPEAGRRYRDYLDRVCSTANAASLG